MPSRYFQRGVRLPQLKEPAASRNIENLRSVKQVFIPLSYGENRVCQPSLSPHDPVVRGQFLGQLEEGKEYPATATVTGVFSEIQNLYHPLYGELSCAVIQCADPQPDPPVKQNPVQNLTPGKILEIARAAGIIDELDGVPFYEKLSSLARVGCDLLVANATEHEPYSSSAWAVLNESAEEVKEGLRLAALAAGASGFHFAVHLSFSRRRALAKRLGEGQLYQIPWQYPVLRYTSANASIGLVGVQACLALYRALQYQEPPCDVVLTVAGDAVANPKNMRVPIGTRIEDVLQACGLSAEPSYILLGDTMTGVTTQSTDIPVLPGMTCLLAMTKRQVISPAPCIGCGRCAKVCHAGLLPYEIVRRLENMHYERLPGLHPEECDGCGACSYVCPAGKELSIRVAEANQSQGTIFLNWGDEDDAE